MATIILKCKQCNKEVVRLFKRRKSKYCSCACYQESKKGKKHSKETKLKMSKAMTGENNPSKRPEVRRKISLACGGNGILRVYKQDNVLLKKLREKIRTRDKQICQICGVPKGMYKMDVHHIDYNQSNHKENNLISLCHSCHTKTRINRSYWKKRLKAIINN